MIENHAMRHFLLFVFALLFPCFALWAAASAPLAVPAIGLANSILAGWFPDVVQAVFVQGADALLMTEFGEYQGALVPLGNSEERIGFLINTRILTYSVPFYAALHFATQKREYLGDFIVGLIILYSVVVFGLLCLCLKELMVNLGGLFFEQADVVVPPAFLIGILYQLNVLILPTLAPVLVWAWQSRETPLMRTMLGSLNAAAEQ